MRKPLSHEPNLDCSICPRLTKFRKENQEKYPDKFNAPVPGFGSLDSELLIIGLAPGLKGANFTGRPFTGDYAGDTLYASLSKHGFGTGTYKADPNDGYDLVNCRIINAVKCLPPENKPTGDEKNKCLPFLIKDIEAMPDLKIILALGTLAHNAALKALGHKQSAFKFGHHHVHDVGNGLLLIDSYHCSRYNTNTGRLTEEMFDTVIKDIQNRL